MFSVLGKLSYNQKCSHCIVVGEKQLPKFSILQRECGCTCALAQTRRPDNTPVLGAHIQLCAIFQQSHEGYSRVGHSQAPLWSYGSSSTSVSSSTAPNFFMQSRAAAVRASASRMVLFKEPYVRCEQLFVKEL